MSKDELVMCVPNDIVAIELSSIASDGIDNRSYFPIKDYSDLEKIIPIKHLGFISRHECENNINFRQLIPYIIFLHRGNILVYDRTSKGSEDRLHYKTSIGFGGHINTADIIHNLEDTLLPITTFFSGMLREIKEEFNNTSLSMPIRLSLFVRPDKIDFNKQQGLYLKPAVLEKVSIDNIERLPLINLLGFIYDNNGVNAVHLGIAILINLNYMVMYNHYDDINLVLIKNNEEDGCSKYRWNTIKELFDNNKLEDWSKIILHQSSLAKYVEADFNFIRPNPPINVQKNRREQT